MDSPIAANSGDMTVMMSAKKFLALLLALAMTLALVACGEKKDDTKTDGAGDGEKTYKVAMICKDVVIEQRASHKKQGGKP